MCKRSHILGMNLTNILQGKGRDHVSHGECSFGAVYSHWGQWEIYQGSNRKGEKEAVKPDSGAPCNTKLMVSGPDL